MEDFYIALGGVAKQGMTLRQLTKMSKGRHGAERGDPEQTVPGSRWWHVFGAPLFPAFPFLYPTLLPRSYLREHHFFAECWNGERGEFVAIRLWKEGG